ncbi:hypothetical protein [Chelativorans xinjiangense]|nr:hypothetical protein [Chelativorans xinjiangense]
MAMISAVEPLWQAIAGSKEHCRVYSDRDPVFTCGYTIHAKALQPAAID